MEPANFPESTGALYAPEGMEDEVSPLYIHRHGALITSCWKPTRAELDEIERTGRIWLTVIGSTMPPVALSGFSLFGEEDSDA